MNESAASHVRIEAMLGDITTVEVDAVVNAANSTLLGGGGTVLFIGRAARQSWKNVGCWEDARLGMPKSPGLGICLRDTSSIL